MLAQKQRSHPLRVATSVLHLYRVWLGSSGELHLFEFAPPVPRALLFLPLKIFRQPSIIPAVDFIDRPRMLGADEVKSAGAFLPVGDNGAGA